MDNNLNNNTGIQSATEANLDQAQLNQTGANKRPNPPPNSLINRLGVALDSQANKRRKLGNERSE
jgi:hypothetical protein